MEMKQIRMGIVGAGTWGETHASSMRSICLRIRWPSAT